MATALLLSALRKRRLASLGGFKAGIVDVLGALRDLWHQDKKGSGAREVAHLG